MNCQDLEKSFVDYVEGELPEADAAEVRRHLGRCAACRAEVESLGMVWNALGDLGDEEPSAALGRHFYTMLEAYQEGQKARLPSWSERFEAWLEGFWPRRPSMQLGVAAAALVVGLVVGGHFGGDDLPVLRSEVEALNRLVSLSLLQQESASARLQGVSYSRRGSGDGEVIAALVETVNSDDNVNVRLAAVDALARFADRRSVTDELRESLEHQDSPLLQLALVDFLFEVNGPESRQAIEKLLARPGLDKTVRGHITQQLPEV